MFGYKYVYMITLFSEEVEVTSTNSDRNTIFVESFEEVFFGVYEFEINGSTVIAEKVGEYDMEPVVAIPVVEADGSKTDVHFDLRRGEFKVSLGVGKTVLTEAAIETVDEEDLGEVVVEIKESKSDQREVNISYQLDRNEVINEIKTDLDATLSELRTETKDIVSDVERLRDEIFIEFTANSDNYRVKETEKLKAFVDTKIATIKKDNKIVAEELEAHVTNSLDSQFGDFVKRVRETQTELKERQKENKRIAAHVTALEKSQLELNNENNILKRVVKEATDTSEKNVNKALSRLGTVKKELTDSKDQFDTIKEDLATSIKNAEERVKLYYHEKIKMVEESVFRNIRREEILDTVKKSKAMILAELNNTNGLKDQLRQLATEASNGEYDPISGKRFQETLKKDLNKKFADEMQNIRRMMEMYSGGGTVAKQYANGGTMNGSLDINGQILSAGVDLNDLGLGGGSGGPKLDSVYTTVQTYSADWNNGGGGAGEVGPGTINNFSIFTATTAIGDSILSQNADGLGISVDGNTTVNGNLSVLGDFTYIDSTVSVTSALSVVNTGTGPAIYAEQAGVGEPIAKFIDSDGGEMVIADTGSVGIGVADPSEKLTVAGNISASGDLSAANVYGANITTIENKQNALYSYLIQNFDTNTVTDATSINDFVTNYPKTGLTTGDVITISATNDAYILGDNDGSALTDWLQVNLKPNFLFYNTNVPDYSVLDVLPLSSAKSSKYIIEVEDKTDGALFYGEVNVVSDGTIAVATEYGLNHTTVFPFVEFGAEVVSGTHIQLSAIALEGKTMGNFIFKGNRANLFG